MSDLESFMAAVRMAETGSFEGNYGAQHYDENRNLIVGAYGFLADQWPYMAQLAQVPGSDWRNPRAQDWVAGHVMTLYNKRYGSWDMAAVAWIAGLRTADAAMEQGVTNLEGFSNEQIVSYVNTVMENTQRVPVNLPRVAPMVTVSPEGWVHPVAGQNEWSRGSFLYQRTASQRSAGKTPVHEGIDIYAAKGTPILSPINGTVVSAGHGKNGGYYAKIKGDDGVTYYFAHMATDARVGKGDTVRAGYHIGYVGNSGNAKGTSPHLHFTMKNEQGQLVNPSNYLQGAVMPGDQFVDPQQHNPRKAMVASLFGSMADAIAGGERQDYRTMGQDDMLPPEDSIAAASNDVISDEPAEEIDMIETPGGVIGL